jgi:hypothetical protein
MILKLWIRIQIAASLLKTNTDAFSSTRRKRSLGGENKKKTTAKGRPYICRGNLSGN